MQPIQLRVGDYLQLKRPHPCGCSRFRLLRVGSDIRMVCTGCGRDLTLPRLRLEPRIKAIEPGENRE